MVPLRGTIQPQKVTRLWVTSKSELTPDPIQERNKTPFSVITNVKVQKNSVLWGENFRNVQCLYAPKSAIIPWQVRQSDSVQTIYETQFTRLRRTKDGRQIPYRSCQHSRMRTRIRSSLTSVAGQSTTTSSVCSVPTCRPRQSEGFPVRPPWATT